MLSNGSRVLAIALAVGCLAACGARAADGDAMDVKVSTFAPAEDLANQADRYIKDLEKAVASEEQFKDDQTKVAKLSNTLAVISLALGLHDQPNKYKQQAGGMMKAAQAVAAAKDFAGAKKAVDALKAAAEGKAGNGAR